MSPTQHNKPFMKGCCIVGELFHFSFSHLWIIKLYSRSREKLNHWQRLTSVARISTIFAKLNLTFLNFANICTHASYGAMQNLASTSLELIKMIYNSWCNALKLMFWAEETKNRNPILTVMKRFWKGSRTEFLEPNLCCPSHRPSLVFNSEYMKRLTAAFTYFLMIWLCSAAVLHYAAVLCFKFC